MLPNEPIEIQNSFLCITTGGLGDAILFSPLFQTIRNRNKTARVDLFVSSPLAREVYQNADVIDNIFNIDLGKQLSVVKATKIVSALLRGHIPRGYDLGVFAAGLNPRLSILFRVLGIVKRTCRATLSNGGRSDLDANLALARKIYPDAEPGHPFVPIDQAAVAETDAALEKNGIDLQRHEMVAIYPSTTLWHRPRMEPLKLLEIAKEIKRAKRNLKVVVVGSRAEGDEIHGFDTDRVVDANLAGQISINAVAHLFRTSKLAVCNDGGLMHVAGVVNCPLIAIMVNTPPSYRPAGENTFVFRSKFDCCEGRYPNRPKNCNFAECTEHLPEKEIIDTALEMLEIQHHSTTPVT